MKATHFYSYNHIMYIQTSLIKHPTNVVTRLGQSAYPGHLGHLFVTRVSWIKQNLKMARFVTVKSAGYEEKSANNLVGTS